MAENFILTINTSNDAFSEGDRLMEVRRILAEASAKLGMDQESGTLRDRNGNTVGLFGFEPEGGGPT